MNLDEYIRNCIIDAYDTENKKFEEDKVFWYYIIIGNQFMFHITCPYLRIRRKVMYRLTNNLSKHFPDLQIEGYCYFEEKFDPNFVHNYFKIRKNNDEVVNIFVCRNCMDKETRNKKYKKLCRTYFSDKSKKEFEELYDLHKLFLPHDMKWSDFRQLYYQSFGRYPEFKVTKASSNVSMIR